VVGNVWPATIVRTHIIHLIRNICRLASRRDWDVLKRLVKAIYTAVNATRRRRAIKPRGHFPSEQPPSNASIWSPDPWTDRARAGTRDHAVDASTERLRRDLRRPIPGRRNLLTENARNTVSETVP
jgi:transposase-like protein